MHAQVKNFCASAHSEFEVKLDGYYIDIVDGDELIEIQTQNFGALKKKFLHLLENHRMRLVYPLVVERFLVTHDEGESIERKSPKRGKLLDVFEELVSVPEFFLYDNFSLDVLLVGAVEHRVVTPKVRWRDKGFKRVAKSLVEIKERHLFKNKGDLLALLPDELPAEFTTEDIVCLKRMPKKRAQQIAYCLSRMNATRCVGHRGRYKAYSLTAR